MVTNVILCLDVVELSVIDLFGYLECGEKSASPTWTSLNVANERTNELTSSSTSFIDSNITSIYHHGTLCHYFYRRCLSPTRQVSYHRSERIYRGAKIREESVGRRRRQGERVGREWYVFREWWGGGVEREGDREI